MPAYMLPTPEGEKERRQNERTRGCICGAEEYCSQEDYEDKHREKHELMDLNSTAMYKGRIVVRASKFELDVAEVIVPVLGASEGAACFR